MNERSLTRSYPLALAALGTIGFTSVLVSSVTSMALGALARALGTSLSSIVWVTTVFLLAAGVALPVAGWGVDRFGGRPVLLLGVAVFAAGSLASGLAQNFEQLLGARVLQGLGGGVLEPACLALLSRITDRRRIGAVMGLMSLLINIAPAVGPLVGAVLLSTGEWRVIFLFSVPPALLAGVLLAFSVRHDRPRPEGSEGAPSRLDVIGLGLLAVGVAASLLAITLFSGGSLAWALPAGGLGILALGAYGWYSLRVATAPVIDLRLFTDRRLSGATAIMGLNGLILFAMLTVAPLLAAGVWDLQGLWQAVPLCVFGAGMLVSMTVSGALSDRTGPRPLVVSGAAGTALLLTAFAACVRSAAPLGVSLVVLALAGLAFGAISAPTFAGIYRVLPPTIAGVGTTAVLIAVQLSASLGVTAIGVMIEVLRGSAFTATTLLLAVLAVATALIAARTLPGPVASTEVVAEAGAGGLS